MPVLNDSPIPGEIALDLAVYIEARVHVPRGIFPETASCGSVAQQGDHGLGHCAGVSGRDEQSCRVLERGHRIRANGIQV